MDTYVLGLICTIVLMLSFCLGALLFLSFDAPFQGKAQQQTPTQISGRFARVQRVDTDTIETVDQAGAKQRWQRQTDETQAGL